MIVDANLLLYAVDEAAVQHGAARSWLEEALNGPHRVGLPWQSLLAFVRIATHPRATPSPLAPAEAWEHVTDWLSAPSAWTPQAGPGFAGIPGRLVVDLELRGNLVPDAALAALCIEHGVAVVSADSDFARFPELRRINPVGR